MKERKYYFSSYQLTLAASRRGEVALGGKSHGKIRINPKKRQCLWVLIRAKASQISSWKRLAALRRWIHRRWFAHCRLTCHQIILTHVAQAEPLWPLHHHCHHQHRRHHHHKLLHSHLYLPISSSTCSKQCRSWAGYYVSLSIYGERKRMEPVV